MEYNGRVGKRAIKKTFLSKEEKCPGEGMGIVMLGIYIDGHVC